MRTKTDIRRQMEKDERMRKDRKDLEATKPKFSEDALGEILIACRTYLDNRRKEIEMPLTIGVHIDTNDPYLFGYFTGMRAGLEMASDLVGCYSEWADKKIYHPDDV